MIKNDDYLEFPDIRKYAKLENISTDILLKAYALEAHYHQLLISEKSLEKRLTLYDEFYSKLIPLYNRKVNIDDRSKDKYVSLFERELKGKSIVDLGCGTGSMLKSIDKLLDTTRLVGLDVVIPEEINDHPKIEFIASNILDFEFQDSFEVAFSDNVIEHLVPEDAAQHVKSIYQNLSENGTLIIIMPNRLFGPWDVTRIKDFSQSGKTEATGGHVNESTHENMRMVLEQAGFKSISTIIPIPKLKYSLFRNVRIKTKWIELIENSNFLLGLFKLIKIGGVCQLKFPVVLIASKK